MHKRKKRKKERESVPRKIAVKKSQEFNDKRETKAHGKAPQPEESLSNYFGLRS